MDEIALIERLKQAATVPDAKTFLTGPWRPDYTREDLEEAEVDKLRSMVEDCGGLNLSSGAALVFKLIDHRLVEPRPVQIKKLWSARIFPLTPRGLRAIMLITQSDAIIQHLRNRDDPTWPLALKNEKLVQDFREVEFTKLRRRKRTYNLPEALNNDILFFELPDEDIRLPEDDVVMFRLRFEPPKQAKA